MTYNNFIVMSNIIDIMFTPKGLHVLFIYDMLLTDRVAVNIHVYHTAP